MVSGTSNLIEQSITFYKSISLSIILESILTSRQCDIKNIEKDIIDRYDIQKENSLDEI